MGPPSSVAIERQIDVDVAMLAGEVTPGPQGTPWQRPECVRGSNPLTEDSLQYISSITGDNWDRSKSSQRGSKRRLTNLERPARTPLLTYDGSLPCQEPSLTHLLPISCGMSARLGFGGPIALAGRRDKTW